MDLFTQFNFISITASKIICGKGTYKFFLIKNIEI